MKRISILFVALCSLVLSQFAVAKTVPLEDFFKNPQFAGFQISPDGKHLAGLAPINDRLNIVVFDLTDRSKPPWAITNEKDQSVSGFQWASDERILFYMDKDGNESLGIFAVNVDGSMPRVLVQPAESQIRGGQRVIKYAQVIDRLRDDPEHVLVVSNERRAEFPDVYKLNIYRDAPRTSRDSDNKSLVQRNLGNIVSWFTDWDGDLRFAGYQDGVEGGWMMKRGDEWVEVTRARYDEPSYQPALMRGDEKTGYVTSYVNPDGSARDKAAVFEYNFETNEFGDLVYEHDVVDCCGIGTTWKDKDLISVSYAVGKPETVYIDEDWKGIMAAIDQALPDTVNTISSVDEELTKGVVVAYSDRQPARYFMYDFANRSLEPLADSRPWINPEDMVSVEPIQYEARDGRTIHGYLAMPKGATGDVPLIVNPHGGPWARNNWGFNPEIQFLTNRGYAVLQTNFRGSTGFGMEHWLSSRKQWGQAMQNDVTDGVKWAIEQGYADEDEVCIYGGSYGGYVVMAGLTYTPDLYQCGINYVGVTDLAVLFETMPDAWNSGREQMEEMVGDPETEAEFLEQWSPANHADKIRVPVFMAYGKQDPRVDIEHAEVMEKALKKAGVDYELMVKKDEGHGYAKQENRFDYYRKMEEFLAEHLGGSSQVAATTSP